MAVPKKKMSKSRTRRRKATHKVSKPHFVVDPETGVAKQSHRVNPTDGTYKTTIQSGGIKTYPDRTYSYNILRVGTTTSFTINVGVSTVPTFYHSGGLVLGLSTSQYITYDKGNDASGNPNTKLAGLEDQKMRREN